MANLRHKDGWTMYPATEKVLILGVCGMERKVRIYMHVNIATTSIATPAYRWPGEIRGEIKCSYILIKELGINYHLVLQVFNCITSDQLYVTSM